MDDIYYVTIVTIYNAIPPPREYKSRCILRDTVTPFPAISHLNLSNFSTTLWFVLPCLHA